MKFRARVRDLDTVDVYAPNGVIFLTLSCSPSVIQSDENCWLAFQRTTDAKKPAIEFLHELWPEIEAWKRFHGVPPLEVIDTDIETEIGRMQFALLDGAEEARVTIKASGKPCWITRFHFTHASEWHVRSIAIDDADQFVSPLGLSASDLESVGRGGLVLNVMKPDATGLVIRIGRSPTGKMCNGEVKVFGVLP